MPDCLRWTTALCVWALVSAAALAAPPNIVFIVADDLGYADLSVHGGKDLRTQHIDALAAAGMRLTNAYASGCVCSPSRVGLLTGRYQQRTGHDFNTRRGFGLAAGETTISQRLKAAGYVTGMVGKWHLGLSPEQHPLARGFDEFYGILEHGIGPAERGNKEIHVYRGRETVAAPADHTTAFGREAVAFIERHREQPFFLYLPFTAVHSPHVAPPEQLKKFDHIADRRRRNYLAMLATLDDQVGQIVAALDRHNLKDNTLVCFMADNGGPDGAPSNAPLRGHKWTLWEGGIRSPLFVVWPGRIAPGTTSAEPVIQLDLVPTALAAAGVDAPATGQLDGVNLLPHLLGKSRSLDRPALFWRFGPQLAVRSGNWKLVKPSASEEPVLFNLADDIGEAKDVTLLHPAKARELQALWDAWNAGNAPPRWEDERSAGEAARKERKRVKKADRL
jgi:arylsulfatase A-like enzyme